MLVVYGLGRQKLRFVGDRLPPDCFFPLIDVKIGHLAVLIFDICVAFHLKDVDFLEDILFCFIVDLVELSVDDISEGEGLGISLGWFYHRNRKGNFKLITLLIIFIMRKLRSF